MQRMDGIQPYEDRALKAAAQFFGRELLPLLGIRETIREPAPTEQVRLEVKDFQEDFNFFMENDSLYHFEFESDEITVDDLRRFRSYESTSSYYYKVDVVTYVICSSQRKKLRDCLLSGINTYRVRVVRLKDCDADKVIGKLKRKKKGSLPRRSLTKLLLTPLMAGEMPQKERILKSVRMIREGREALSEEERRQMESVLYAFAMKFLSKRELEEIWEVFRMTLLGELLVGYGEKSGKEAGMKAGLEIGKREGKEEGLEIGIKAFVLEYLEDNMPKEHILDRLVRRFPITREEAERYYSRFSREADGVQTK